MLPLEGIPRLGYASPHLTCKVCLFLLTLGWHFRKLAVKVISLFGHVRDPMPPSTPIPARLRIFRVHPSTSIYGRTTADLSKTHQQASKTEQVSVIHYCDV